MHISARITKACLRKGDKILVLLRSPSARFYPLHWDFPGGKLEVGEEITAGVTREIQEEIGVLMPSVRHVTTFVLRCTDVHGVVEDDEFNLFEGSLESTTITISHEHKQFAWHTREELLSMQIEPFLREYLTKYSS